MITRMTGQDRGDEAERTAALGRWRAYRGVFSARAERLQDAPSQVLAGIKAWRQMNVCPRTGAERIGG